MHIISTTKALKTFCTELTGKAYMTIDTEFIREKTYYAKLCLIQVASSPEHAAIIDPLAEGIDLKPLFELLADDRIVKVFHAARQDIEIFYGLSGHMPRPIFDTQVAAAVSGYGESVSYETLVNKIAGAELDKSSRFSDWSARPLTERQLEYAISDVTHLCKIYETLNAAIEKAGRSTWIAEEHAQLIDPALYTIEPSDSWKRLKSGNMRAKNLAVLRELAKWREIEARAADVPRGRIMKDEALIELALVMPRKESDMGRMRNMDKHLSKSRIHAIIDCVEKALALPSSEWPQQPKARRLPEQVANILAMLQLLLKIKADIHQIAPSIIAGKDDLEALATGATDIPILSGWRYDVFGSQAELLMQGKLKLSLHPKSKAIMFEEVV